MQTFKENIWETCICQISMIIPFHIIFTLNSSMHVWSFTIQTPRAAYKLPNPPLKFDPNYPYGHWGLVELVTSTMVGLVIIDI